MKAKRLGDLIQVPNKERQFGSARKYNFFRLQDEQGNEVNYLATDNELAVMHQRAESNPEDLLKVGAIRDLFD